MSSLQKLINSESGVYCAPLRLLAREIFDKIQKTGRNCNLLTGEYRFYNPDATLSSCTIEMLDLEKEYKVGIIVEISLTKDEIQMINDIERGSAWTNSVLGMKAHEIHLCGEARSA